VMVLECGAIEKPSEPLLRPRPRAFALSAGASPVLVVVDEPKDDISAACSGIALAVVLSEAFSGSLKKVRRLRESALVPQTALLRLIFRGQVRWALPHTLVEETSDRVALLIVPGVRGRGPKGYGRSDYVDQLLEGWNTVDHVWHTNRVLRLTTFDAGYSVDHYWSQSTDEFRGYQINLQEPLRRTSLGFDTFDQELDIVVTPDRSWHWKDVDNFERAVRRGVFSHEEGTAVRELARDIAGRLEELIPTGWEDWPPDLAWPLPELPNNWQEVDTKPV
jgi:hypothetical protein